MWRGQVSDGRLVRGAIALAALTTVAVVAPARAQNAPVQLAFGYDCGDRFQVRNDGGQSVDVEYGVAGAARSSARISPKESVAITSQSNHAMELWVNGRRVSTEAKGNRACSGSQDVVVRPLNGGDYANNAATNSNDNVSYTVQPTNTVYVTTPAPQYYPYYDSYYYGYGYGYGGYGYGAYYPYYRTPILSLVVPFGGSRYYSGGSRTVYGGSRGGSVGHGGGGGGRTAVRR